MHGGQYKHVEVQSVVLATAQEPGENCLTIRLASSGGFELRDEQRDDGAG